MTPGHFGLNLQTEYSGRIIADLKGMNRNKKYRHLSVKATVLTGIGD